MFSREYLAALNQFSDEARGIVESSPPLGSMPAEIKEMAVGRVKWENKDALVQPDLDSVKAEVLSFYLMCQSVASVSHPYSRETRFVSDATKRIMKYRIYDMFRRGQEELCLEAARKLVNIVELEKEGSRILGGEIPRDDAYRIRDLGLKKDGIELVDERLLPQYLPKYAVRWAGISPLMRHRRVELTDFYLMNGWAVITPRDLWSIYSELVGVKTEEYIQSVYERFEESGAPPQLLLDVGSRISSFVPKLPEFKGAAGRVIGGKLKPEFFPPCINICLGGAGSGARNFAINMLLAPFLSYARAAPSGRTATRIADFINDISVVNEEIAPLIFDAAERCNPPLFKDQPQEKANVFYHMGFGMTTEPRLEDSGKSKWYRVPNCIKIQMSAPPLCRPDEFCRKIRNPLTYYFRKKAEAFGGGAKDADESKHA
ncbi:MAG: hypothetical protein AB1305_04410 [Candidatus Hadarchaeota archaeon]